jgi:hypothetical protein
LTERRSGEIPEPTVQSGGEKRSQRIAAAGETDARHRQGRRQDNAGRPLTADFDRFSPEENASGFIFA